MVMFSVLFVTFALFQCIYGSTEYPLYAIFDGGDKLTTDDFKLIAENFKAAQAGVNSTAAKQIHSMNANFKIVHYTDDWQILNLTDGEYNKSNPLRYGFGTLVSSLTAAASDTTITISLFSHFTQIPFKKSTTSSEYSLNCNEAVTWIRIDNEYMKVTNVDNTHKELTVQRGFIGNGSSKAVLLSHAKNATIFTAAYSSAPPGTSGCTKTYQYMLNPESEYAVNHYGDMVYTDIKNGLDGSWYDNMGGYPPFPVDGLDNGLPETLIWDENNNDYFKDCNQYRVAQQNRLTATYDYLSTKYKLSPSSVTIWANNMASQHYNKCDLYKFLQANPPSYPYPLDGYCMEGYSVHQSGDCDHNQIAWLDLDKWISNVDELINVTARGIAGMPMIAQAGCKAKGVGQLNDTMYQQVILHGYVTYLMGVNSRNSSAYFGVPALRFKDNKWYAYVDDVFFYNIGNPVEIKPSVNEYKISGHISYQRSFENGIAIVNPNNKTDNDIALSKEYLNPKTNKTVKNLNVTAHTAYILLNE